MVTLLSVEAITPRPRAKCVQLAACPRAARNSMQILRRGHQRWPAVSPHPPGHSEAEPEPPVAVTEDWPLVE